MKQLRDFSSASLVMNTAVQRWFEEVGRIGRGVCAQRRHELLSVLFGFMVFTLIAFQIKSTGHFGPLELAAISGGVC